MKNYRLYTVIIVLLKFLNELINLVLENTQASPKGEISTEDCFRCSAEFLMKVNLLMVV
jgi:hypothetical protein